MNAKSLLNGIENFGNNISLIIKRHMLIKTWTWLNDIEKVIPNQIHKIQHTHTRSSNTAHMNTLKKKNTIERVCAFLNANQSRLRLRRLTSTFIIYFLYALCSE